MSGAPNGGTDSALADQPASPQLNGINGHSQSNGTHIRSNGTHIQHSGIHILTNGYTNGHSDGHSDGHSNGLSNGNHVESETSNGIVGTVQNGHPPEVASYQYSQPSETMPIRSRTPLPECMVCVEPLDPLEVARLRCGHRYCPPCFEWIFENATTHESSFPAKCCGIVIDIDLARGFLSAEVLARHEEKRVELVERLYCHVSDCSTVLDRSIIKDGKAQCSNCGAATCALCGRQAHGGDCRIASMQQYTEYIQQELARQTPERMDDNAEMPSTADQGSV